MALLYGFNFWSVPGSILLNLNCAGFLYTSFLVTTRRLDLFSGAYLNTFECFCDTQYIGLARSNWSIRLGASLPVDGSRAGFRNTMFKKFR
jgi:hypothetical protein